MIGLKKQAEAPRRSDCKTVDCETMPVSTITLMPPSRRLMSRSRLQAVVVRHVDVEQHDAMLVIEQPVEQLRRIVQGDGLDFKRPQHHLDQLSGGGIVVDVQDGPILDEHSRPFLWIGGRHRTAFSSDYLAASEVSARLRFSSNVPASAVRQRTMRSTDPTTKSTSSAGSTGLSR